MLIILFTIALAIAFGFCGVYFAHMFQLESYLSPQYLKWLKTAPRPRTVGVALVSLAAMLLVFAVPYEVKILFASALFLVCAVLCRPYKKAKKPFVFTARVKRLMLTYAFLGVFCYLLLATTNLYVLAPMLLILSPLLIPLANFLNTPVEKAVRNHYIKGAKAIIRARGKTLTVIGITGSYGKTGTKYYLNKILSQKYNVLMTPASYNTTMGVVKVIREMLKPSHEIFICEMGARNVGEIKEICDIVLPDHGIITSVGEQHLETFKTIENIIATKFELADAVKAKNPNGILLVNGDNAYIRDRDYQNGVLYYGTGHAKNDFLAHDITVSASGSSFTMTLPGSEPLSLSTRLIGGHTVQNIAGCVAMAHLLGEENREIARGVKMLESVPHRLELVDGGDVVIIDDAFNSNPSGAKAALDVLSVFDGLRVLVTPGMVELGEKQDALNTVLGTQAAVCDEVFIVGKVNAASITTGLQQAGFDKTHLHYVSRPEEAVDAVRRMPTVPGKKKYVLLENDLPDNFR